MRRASASVAVIVVEVKGKAPSLHARPSTVKRQRQHLGPSSRSSSSTRFVATTIFR